MIVTHLCNVTLVIKHQGKGRRIDDIIMEKPSEDDLYHFKDPDGSQPTNYTPDHPLNTDLYKKKLMIADDVTTFCFYSDQLRQLMFSGYGDGLICVWNTNSLQPNEESIPSVPLIGHTNKINHLEAVEALEKLFSSSNDCTLRQWAIEPLGVCERIFKFQDPVNVCKIHLDKGMIFAGCWDRQVRAIEYKTGVVDRAFLAANSGIKSLHIHENWLFTGSCESQIRAFNLDSGETKSYEGHESWVNCMATYYVLDDEGNVKNTWLLSGSDDKTIRIWDMNTCKRLEKLQEHKNGVLCLALTARDTPCDSLYSGGQDHFTIYWDMRVVEQRIHEMLRMESEELLSRKAEAKDRYLEAKFGRKRGKKGKGKGKKGKKK